MIESILYILKEAFKHTLPLMPFIFLVFIIIEIVETKAINFAKKKQSKKTGPTTWASIGLFPHCGVGIIGAKLFSKKYITRGSLIAVIIAITDEAIFMLLDHPAGWVRGLKIIIAIIAIKFIYAVLIGKIVDYFFKNEKIESCYKQIDKIIGENNVCNVHKHGYDHSDDTRIQRFLIHPLKHSLPLIIFIFIVNFIMDGLIYVVGEEVFEQFFYEMKFLQPLFAVLVGIIPNCVGSIILISLYTEGVLIFPALIGGLINQAGLTKMVLLRENKNLKDNLIILSIITVSGLLLGYGLLLLTGL